MSTIVQITPCTDWFYLIQDQHTSEWKVRPIAAWGLTSAGEVLGMLPVDGIRDSASPEYPHLKPAPNSGGRFVHISMLSERQLTAAKSLPY